MFAEEKPARMPLPLEPFRHYQFGERRVNLDGCVEVEVAYYSAPPGWIGRSVNGSGTAASCAWSILVRVSYLFYRCPLLPAKSRFWL